MFSIGLGIFTLASAAAALSTSATMLDIARAVQGVGGAIVMPLTLTILSAGVPKERRGLALGLWGGISGLAVAFGPLVGGAVVSGISWHWIFWLNVPIGLVLAPLALSRLDESRGPVSRLDLPGLVLASAGLFGIVWGLVRGNAIGWSSPEIVGALAVGALVTALFVRLGAADRAADAADALLPQPHVRARERLEPVHVLRDVRLDLPALAVLPDRAGLFAAAVRACASCPWTAMPILISPLAGAFSDRIGGHRLMGAGLALQAIGPRLDRRGDHAHHPVRRPVAPFALSGMGMALFFAPVANVVLSSVRPEQEGQASGANNAIRELGGVFGVAVLASIFAHYGGYRTGETFAHGMSVAVYVGAAIVAVGSLAAFSIGRGGMKQVSGERELVAELRSGLSVRTLVAGAGTARIALAAIWPPSRAVTSTFTFQPSRSDSSRASRRGALDLVARLGAAPRCVGCLSGFYSRVATRRSS